MDCLPSGAFRGVFAGEDGKLTGWHGGQAGVQRVPHEVDRVQACADQFNRCRARFHVADERLVQFGCGSNVRSNQGSVGLFLRAGQFLAHESTGSQVMDVANDSLEFMKRLMITHYLLIVRDLACTESELATLNPTAPLHPVPKDEETFSSV